jgi:hypothetical protein
VRLRHGGADEHGGEQGEGAKEAGLHK